MISIITITYNNFEELKNTLDSIHEAENIESIVVNGGNDLQTLEYLKSYSGKVINEEDSGIAEAFNKGLKISSGEFIMFLNSGDVLLDSEYLAIAEDHLKKHSDLSFIHSNILFYDNVAGEIFMRPQMKSLGRGQPYFHPTMVVRKSCFDKIGDFNTSYEIAMDFDFIVRMKKYSLKGKYIDGRTVVKMAGFGKSSEKEKEAIKECYKSLKENDLLSINNCFGYLIRKILFASRKLMELVGAKDSLSKLKRKKHSA